MDLAENLQHSRGIALGGTLQFKGEISKASPSGDQLEEYLQYLGQYPHHFVSFLSSKFHISMSEEENDMGNIGNFQEAEG